MVMATPSPQQVGREFVRQYYTVLHEAPEVLHRFYSSGSTFVHGGVDRPGLTEEPVTGQLEIDAKIKLLNFKDCHTKIRQVDSQSTIGSGVVVQVTGELSNNGEPMRRFMQTFVLAPQTPKKFYVHNDIFRYQDEVYQDNSDTESEDHQSLIEAGAVTTVTSTVSSSTTLTANTVSSNTNNNNVSSSSSSASSGQAAKVNMPYYQTTGQHETNVSVTVQQQPQQQPSLSSSSSSSSADLDNKLQDMHLNEQMHNGQSTVDAIHHNHNHEGEVLVTEEKVVVSRVQLKAPTPNPINGDVDGGKVVAGKVGVEVDFESVSSSNKKDESLVRPQESAQGGADTKNSWAKIITNKSEAAAPNIQSQQQYPFNNTANKFGTKDNGVTNGSSAQSQKPTQNGSSKSQNSKPRNPSSQTFTAANTANNNSTGLVTVPSTAAQLTTSSSSVTATMPSQPQPQRGERERDRNERSSRVDTNSGNNLTNNTTNTNTTTTAGSSSFEDDEKRFGRYPDSQQVFVGNLSQDLSEAELKYFFGTFGKVVEVRINTNTKQQSGRRLPNYGFVVFDDKLTVDNLLGQSKSNNLTYKNDKGIEFRLNVEEKRARQGREGGGGGGRDSGFRGSGKPNRATRSSSNGSRGGGGNGQSNGNGGSGMNKKNFNTHTNDSNYFGDNNKRKDGMVSGSGGGGYDNSMVEGSNGNNSNRGSGGGGDGYRKNTNTYRRS